MDAELASTRRQWAFAAHLLLFVGGAIVGALGLGGTWIAGVAAAGACWIASGVAAMLAGRSVMVPRSLRAMQGPDVDPEHRAAVERAGAVMGGILLILLGTITAMLGWGYLVTGGR